MRIVLITEYFPDAHGIITGGVERRVLRIAQHLSKNHSVTIVAANTILPSQREIAGVRVIRCGSPRVYTSRGSLFLRLYMLYDMLRRGKTVEGDLVEATNATVYLVGFLIGMAMGTKSVAWVPDVVGRSLFDSLGVISGTTAFLMERVGLLLPWDRYIALSLQTKSKLERLGIPGSKIKVVYGGVDTAVKMVMPSSPKQILTISRLVSYKRVEDIITALPLVKSRVPEVRLCIVGDGPQKERLVKLARESGVADSVEFIAHVSDAKLRAVMSKSMLYCSASLVEGFGLSVMEALARGVPAVISDIETHQEITGGDGVLFFRPRDPKDLSDKLVDLLTNKRLWYKKSREARQLASRYSWPHIAAQTLAVYNRVVQHV